MFDRSYATDYQIKSGCYLWHWKETTKLWIMFMFQRYSVRRTTNRKTTIWSKSTIDCKSINFKDLFLFFQPPQPLLTFKEDILDCSRERDVCFHVDMLSRKFVGSEDCLHLNVYTPAQSDSNDALPVMIWFHGGAFKFGSGNSD